MQIIENLYKSKIRIKKSSNADDFHLS